MQTDTSTPDPAAQDIHSHEPVAAPRAITSVEKRAIFIEPHVRRWWLLLLLIVFVFVGYTFNRLWERDDEIKLLTHGLTVKAYLSGAENKNKGQLTNANNFAQLQLQLPNGPETVTGVLVNPTVVGTSVTVHVDPQDHSHWTDRTEPTPLIEAWLVGFIFSPLLPLALLLAILKTLEAQKVWRTGSAQLAVVYDRKQSAIAPMSYMVRCSLQNQTSKDLFTVYVPRSGAHLRAGDLIWIITPVRKGPALAGLWMGRGSVQV